MAYLGEDDPDFLQWLQTGSLPPPAPAPVGIQPPQIQPLRTLPPLGRGGMAPTLARNEAATTNLVQATQDVAGAQGFVQQKAAEIAQPGMEQDAARMQENMAERDEQRARIDATAKSIQERVRAFAQEEIDPTRFVKEADTWQKIVMGVGMAVAGYLNPRGPNTVFEAIMGLIDRDIAGQKANIAKKGQVLDIEREMNKEESAKSRADYLENEERRLMLLEAVKQRAMAEASRLGANANAQANANMLAAQAQAKQEEIALSAAGRIESARISAAPGMMQAKTDRIVKTQIQPAMAIMQEQGRNTRDLTATPSSLSDARTASRTFVDPFTKQQTVGLDKERVEKTQEFAQNYKLARELIDKMTKDAGKMDFTDKLGSVPIIGGTDLAEQASSDYGALMKLLAKMESMGANWTGNEVDNIRQRIGRGPNVLWRKDPSRALQETKRFFDDWADAAASYAGVPNFAQRDAESRAQQAADELEDY